MTVTIPEWHKRANCATADGEAFFPEKGGTNEAAKRVCRRCFVRTQCLDDALARNERFGILGGLSVPERDRIRRGRAA